jgi:hypothetical protein
MKLPTFLIIAIIVASNPLLATEGTQSRDSKSEDASGDNPGCRIKPGLFDQIGRLNRLDELAIYTAEVVAQKTRGELSDSEAQSLVNKKVCEIVGRTPYQDFMRESWSEVFQSTDPQFAELPSFALATARHVDDGDLAWVDADRIIRQKYDEIKKHYYENKARAKYAKYLRETAVKDRIPEIDLFYTYVIQVWEQVDKGELSQNQANYQIAQKRVEIMDRLDQKRQRKFID